MQIREIKEKLAGMNLLVEDWGGNSTHDISAKVELGKKIIRKYYLKQKF
jgi:translation initiation factor IF-2